MMLHWVYCHQWGPTPVQNFVMTGLIIGFMGAFANQAAAHIDIPDLGSSSRRALSVVEEKQIGQSVMRQLQAVDLIGDDPVITQYLQRIGKSLIGGYPPFPFDLTIFWVRDNTPNAFALPGGYVGFHTGLMLLTQQESELAAVMAHELAHISQRHLARQMSHAQRLKIGTWAGILAAILVSTQNAEAGQGALMAAMGGTQQQMLQYSRQHEEEADAIGIRALAEAGYEPMAMSHFFKRLHHNAKLSGDQFPEYLRTHPLTEDRMARSESRAHQMARSIRHDSLHYHLIKARLTVLSQAQPLISPEIETQTLKGASANQLAVQYARALTLGQQGQLEASGQLWRQLVEAEPNEPIFIVGYAEQLLVTQAFDKLNPLLEQAKQTHPNELSLLLIEAKAAMAQGAPERAIVKLSKYRLSFANQPSVLKLLAKAYAQTHQMADAHGMEAAYRLSRGDLVGAKRQYIQALRQPDLTAAQKARFETAQQQVERLLTAQQ